MWANGLAELAWAKCSQAPLQGLSTGAGSRTFDIELLLQFARARMAATLPMLALTTGVALVISLWATPVTALCWWGEGRGGGPRCSCRRDRHGGKALTPVQLLARGGWDYELVEALAPQPGDIRLHKTRYSAFFNSQLDSTLRSRGIRTIVFVGIASNVCVESTLRDAFHLEYFGVMLEDATHHLGPDFIQQATVYNVEKFFGWVSTVNDFCGAIGQAAPADAAE